MSGYEIAITCPRCGGTGQDPELFDGDYQDCGQCENNRRIWVPLASATNEQIRQEIADKLTERDDIIASLATNVGDLVMLREELSRRKEPLQ